MWTPSTLELMAKERIQVWEAHIRHRQLIAQIPSQPPLWRLWLGAGLFRIGIWFMRWATGLARQKQFLHRPVASK